MVIMMECDGVIKPHHVISDNPSTFSIRNLVYVTAFPQIAILNQLKNRAGGFILSRRKYKN